MHESAFVSSVVMRNNLVNNSVFYPSQDRKHVDYDL
jgi:hypothetical protein